MHSCGWKTGLVGILLSVTLSAQAQQVRVVKWSIVQQLLDQKSDTNYVINFLGNLVQTPPRRTTRL